MADLLWLSEGTPSQAVSADLSPTSCLHPFQIVHSGSVTGLVTLCGIQSCRPSLLLLNISQQHKRVGLMTIKWLQGCQCLVKNTLHFLANPKSI